MKTAHPVIIGIDTHKASHVAVAIDTQGTRLAALSILTNPKGYLELERWARYEEIIAHDKELERLVTERASDLMASLGITWHSDTDRSGNVDTCWRRSNAHPLTSSICKALWCLCNPCMQR
mgnify:FL=1